jgi:hypothetical protein
MKIHSFGLKSKTRILSPQATPAVGRCEEDSEEDSEEDCEEDTAKKILRRRYCEEGTAKEIVQ